MTRVLVVAATQREAAFVPEHLPCVISDIGKVEAGVQTTAAIAEHRPEVVVNVGTAGSLRSGVSGLFLPSRVINHDLDSVAIRALGHHPIDELTIPGGDGTVLATGDQFVADVVLRDRLAEHADLVDMEGFAVVRAAQAMDVEVRLVKIVSDEADDSARDWLEVVARCARELGDWLSREYPTG